MNLPPKNPIQGKFSYFDLLCAEAQKYLPDIRLDFNGYSDLVERYVQLSDLDTDANFEMSKEFNAWGDYFSEVASAIQNQYLDSETDKLQVFSQSSLDASEKSVAAGDRKANTDAAVIVARKKRNCLKSLYDALTAKQSFCEKAFYQCKYNCIDNAERSGGSNVRRRNEY